MRRFFFFQLLCWCVAALQLNAQAKPNVVFIFIDDLRPDLGCYGNAVVKSPHLDQLAGKGALFTNEYATVPTCGASRFGLLTGRYPAEKAALGNEAAEKIISGKPQGASPETFIEQFRRNGYHTVGIGKISHSADGYLYGYTEPRSNKPELPNSWDEMLFNAGKWQTGWNAFFGYADGSNRQGKKGQVKPYEAGDCDDDGYPDGLTANLATEKIRTLAQSNQPFFLGIGFFKPHLPFTAPRRYWDLYDEASIPLTPSPNIPEGVNPASLHQSGEFNQYKSGDEAASLSTPLSDNYARKLRHAYYAAISYVDAQVGKVLEAIRKNGLDKNTIIVVWGDHGWHLGDDRVWGKHTVFEWSLRSAFIVKTPGSNNGVVRNEIVSAADIYPTLMELCGLKMPYRGDGESLAKLLQQSPVPSWRNTAISYFNKGISIRTPRYRYTQYFREATPVIELYDHLSDPRENKNSAAENPKIVAEMQQRWQKEIENARKIYKARQRNNGTDTQKAMGNTTRLVKQLS
ncbi:sulfatase [Niabella hirudinis]|uniref:sulfatase n=1 Tax=Niabella hirudinis TaxID=1285929 RepID=UPI003EBA69D2